MATNETDADAINVIRSHGLYPLDMRECPHLKLIRSWASVQRTMDNVLNALESMIPDGDIPDDVDRAISEVKDIGPALDWLHQTVRDTIR